MPLEKKKLTIKNRFASLVNLTCLHHTCQEPKEEEQIYLVHSDNELANDTRDRIPREGRALTTHSIPYRGK